MQQNYTATPLNIREMNLEFFIGKTRFHIIDSAHGIFFQSFPRHMHSFYEFHYIYKGSGILVTDYGSFPLQKGDAYMIPPRMQHEQITVKDNYMEEFHIAFEMHAGEENAPFYSSICAEGFWLGKDTHNMSEIYEKIETELRDKQPGLYYSLQALFSEIFIAYMRDTFSLKKKEAPAITKDEKRALMVDEVFLYSYATISLPALAELLNLSVNHTHRFIVKQYGMSFTQLRTVARLNAAAGLLSNTDTTISLISDTVGFSNPIYFTEKFKEHFGITPSAYRKQSAATSVFPSISLQTPS